jgi:hypothetical protein
MKNIRSKYLWQKTPLLIDDIVTIHGDIIEVILQETGKPVRLRRDMAEFFPNVVFIPLWLAERIRGNKIDAW